MATTKSAGAAKPVQRKAATRSKVQRRSKPPAPRRSSSQPPKVSSGSQRFSQVAGGTLFLAAIAVGLVLTESVSPGAVTGAVGEAYFPLLIVLGGPALLVLFRPRSLLGTRPSRAALGTGALLLASVTVLGALGAGGRLGASSWSLLASMLGGGAGLVVVGVAVLGCWLLGLHPRKLVKALLRVLRLALSGLSAVCLSLIGAVVWVARRRGSRRAAEAYIVAPAEPKKGGRKPKAPAIPELADAVESEATQPIERLPVIQTVIEEPPQVRAPEDWSLPPITLLTPSDAVEVSEADARRRAKVIEDTLSSFGVQASVREINPGPTVTQFALEPGPGTKVSRITSLQNDLALALAAPSIRMEAPVPGQSRVGIEIPNADAVTVRLRDVMDSGAFYSSKGKLKLALGRDVTGRSVVGDLTRMPHLLIAGATGAGKSSCLNSIIVGFLFQQSPEELRFLMVDPKMVELKTFDGIPHLVWPVVTEVDKVVGVLKYAVAEMERRYKEFSSLGIRNLDGYNRKMSAEGLPQLPRMVVIIDELADLMIAAPEEVEASICRLAQMARAVGIHLILATQRPSVDVLTGLIKANFPSRIAFAVSSQIDSRVILDHPGAERLLGRGDMLFVGPDSAKPLRVQGTFVSDEEIESVVGYWKDLQPAEYDPQVGKILEAESAKSQNPHEDPLLAQALELAESHARLSTSLLQRKLRIGYNRAARLMDALRESGELDTELDG
ncbi:MAG: DNA translocase FtsK [Chloroflexota bacterium]|nr:DNA translocase FtsK [Chloroflexota bacterium]